MKTYSEIPLDKLFYDPSLPQKTYTAEEWFEIFGSNVPGIAKPDTKEFDKKIYQLYEEQGISIQGIIEKLNLPHEFIAGRLIFMGVDISMKRRGGRKVDVNET